MKALSKGAYADGQQVNTKNWRLDLLRKRAKIPVDIECEHCGKLHRGNTGWLVDGMVVGTTFSCSAVEESCRPAKREGKKKSVDVNDGDDRIESEDEVSDSSVKTTKESDMVGRLGGAGWTTWSNRMAGLSA